ncbi:MAG: hypothetical protein WAK55_14630 [Xanthobacteraceae bacterium]
MTTRKQMIKGFGDQDPDIESFLRPDGNGGTDPWKIEEHSTVGYNAAKSDNSGTRDWAGYGVDGAQDSEAFSRPSFQGDVDYVNQSQSYLIDSDPSLPSNKLVAGGGALSQRGGVGSGPATRRPKTGPQANRDSRGGVSRQGRR